MSKPLPILQSVPDPNIYRFGGGTALPWQHKEGAPYIPKLAELNLKQTSLTFDSIKEKNFATSVAPFEVFLSEGSQAVRQKRLDERIYDLLADAKIRTRLVANHLPHDWQSRLFAQLDELHDVNLWESDDLPMSKDSFDTFLVTILTIHPTVRPGLGLTHTGNISGTWGTKNDYITMVFLPGNKLQWTIFLNLDGNLIRSASNSPVAEFEKYLAPFNPSHWWYRDAKR